MIFLSASLNISFKYIALNLIPLLVSILLMILGTVIYLKENHKNGVIVKSLALAVPVLFSLNGTIISGFNPFRFILLALVFAAFFVYANSSFFPEKIDILKLYLVVVSNATLIYAFSVMRQPGIEIFIIALVLGIVPLLFHIKKLIKNKSQIFHTILVMLSGSFVLSFALNLPALSIGSFMFPIGALINFVGVILYINFHLNNLEADKEKFSIKLTVISFLFLIGSNFYALGINF